MKNALIDPTVVVDQLTSWQPNPDPSSRYKYLPVYTPIANSARVAETAASEFPVAEPLFWVQCADDVVADQWYYDMVNQVCIVAPAPAPYPDASVVSQAPVEGAQTL